MTAAAARAQVKQDLCLVDSHPAEHDCRRVKVDFRVHVQFGTLTFALRAVEMCAAGITLAGEMPLRKGDEVKLRIAFPGRGAELYAHGIITRSNSGQFGCEYWADNSYEQLFLNEFMQACARRLELRNNAACEHP